jgi:hypothetical protein
MTIGPDIEEAINEAGTAFTIIRDSGNVTGEYLYYKPNAQVTKPFIREYFLEAWFTYQTSVAAGDIVEFNVTEDRYIVMNITALLYENEAYRYDGVLYKTNVQADILRPTHIRNSQYRMRTMWSLYAEDVDCLLTTPLHGHDLETDEEVGLLGIENHELYVPDSIGLQVHDRLRLSPTEYFRVEVAKKRRYPAVTVFDVGEDTREWTTTTTTTSSSTTTTTTA